MSIMQRLNGSKRSGVGGAAPPAEPTSTYDGRARLRHSAAELAKAKEAAADVEARLDRLVTIIRDADAAHEALQKAVAADGAVSLKAYAAGKASDHPIAALILTEENTARAAAAAKVALPKATAMLDAARAEVARLAQLKDDAALEYLKSRADEVALAYKRTFNALCICHDKLVGISAALASSGEFGGDVVMTTLPVTVPRFNLPSTADKNEYLPTMIHHAADTTVGDARSSWMQARARLTKDADADLDDILGPTLLEHEADKNL